MNNKNDSFDEENEPNLIDFAYQWLKLRHEDPKKHAFIHGLSNDLKEIQQFDPIRTLDIDTDSLYDTPSYKTFDSC